MEEQLEQFIGKQGWSMFGIVEFEKIRKNLEKHEKIFQEWVKKGFEADMDYLEKMEDDRYHPDHKLPDVKSVIVLGAIYSDGGSNSGSNSGSNGGSNSGSNGGPNGGPNGGAPRRSRATVARYARGRDYHKVLKRKLIDLSNWLKTSNVKGSASGGSNVETYVSVDSGPTVDRVLAEAAGLGFFGKNTCLIDPSKGSYFFIASVLTNLELESTSKKHMPNCGDCQNCLKNCPTGALVKPGVLDARKCISYLTIENKEGIPVDLRPKIGNRLFGCDACQEVCPFNVGRAHKQEVRIEKLEGRNGVGESLDLREVLSIRTDEEFKEKFAGTPLMRAKRRGLLRNACVVAGNSDEKSLIPYLEELIERESDKMLKEHAEWGIEQLQNF